MNIEVTDTTQNKYLSEINNAFLGIIFEASLLIRSQPNNEALCYLVADHIHNLPLFLTKPLNSDSRKFVENYMASERIHLINQLKDMKSEREIRRFEPYWQVIHTYLKSSLNDMSPD